MASDIVITPNRGSTTVNAKIDFTGASTASSQIRLEVLPDNSLSFVGTTGSLFSIADSVTGSLMSVNDASGLPILEVFDTDKVVMGQYNQNTLVVNGTNVGIGTGSPNSKLEIRGGTTNQTYDATVYITADNDNDWGITIDKNRSLATEYGLKISTGSAASYALAVYGGGSLSTRIAGNGDIYAPRVYDSTATAYYVDPGSTSNLNGLTVAATITGSISGNAATATTATTATNWGTYGAVPAAGTSFGGASTIGRSDSNGYTYFNYINSNTPASENPTISQFVVLNATDNFYRKASLASVKNQMSLNNVENTALSTWAGSSNITTLGTISTGTWQGSVIESTYGGTGVNNAGRTLTISTNSGTISFTNASTTLTVANNASVSGTNTGDQTIGNGTLSLGVSGNGLSGSASFTANQSSAGIFTVTSNATSSNGYNTIVYRDGSGNFAAGTITADLSGTATYAGMISGNIAAGTSKNIVDVTVGDNDFFRITAGSTSSNAGYVEFSTYDDGTEPIRFVQSGIRTLTLLDSSGNTSIPGTLSIAGNTAIHAGNYTSYTIPYSGSGRSVSGWMISGLSNGSSGSPLFYLSHSSGYGMHINTYNTSGSIYAMELHSNTKQLFVVYNDGSIYMNGGNAAIHAGNYNSYAPSLTGTGASGTWGISITGNAATATSADQIDGVPFRNSISSGPVNADNLDSNGITYYTSGVTNFSGNSTDGALYSQAYSSSWQHQIAGDYRSGQIALRGKNNGTWQSWRTVLDSSNYTSYVGNGTLTLNTSGNGISGSTSFGANSSGSATFTVYSNATAANTTNTIVYRDGSGNFSAGQITGSSFIKNSITVPGVFIQSGATSGAPSAIQNGDLWWNTDTGKLKIYWSTASAWVDATPVPDMAGYYTTGGGNINGNVNVNGLLESTGNITARIGQTYPVSIGSHPSYSGANYGALWRPGSNPVLLFDASNTYVNAPSLGAAVSFQVGNTTHAYVNSNGVTTNGSFIMSGGFTLSQTGGYGQTNNWIHLNGYHGLYSVNNSAHIYPNSNSSYGAWAINGSRNSWGGIYDNYSGIAWMGDAGGNGGLYRESNGRWYIYHNTAHNCTAIGSSNTTSGYAMQVTGSAYVTGSVNIAGNTALHGGNYNSYAPTLTGGGASGVWSINVTGSAGLVSWVNVSARPTWMTATNLIETLTNFNNSRPSGFYQGSSATNAPTAGTWYNLINVRHDNVNNDHGFQLAMSYYSNVLYHRHYQGGTGQNDGSFSGWATVLSDQNYTSYVGNGTLTLNVSGTGLSGSTSFTANQSGNTTFTVTSNATSANTASTIVARDGNGDFSARIITAVTGIKANTGASPIVFGCSNSAAGTSALSSIYQSTSSGLVITTKAGSAYGMFWEGPAGQSLFNLSTGGTLTINDTGYTTNFGGPVTVSGNTVLNAGNYNSYAPTLTGGGASGSWGISVTGTSRYLAHNDGPRNLSDRNPNWSARTAIFDFIGAGTAGTSGNYAGVLTFVPWDGTTGSTGDASYQLAFGSTATNGGGLPHLRIRKGIDTTWNSWYTIPIVGVNTGYQGSIYVDTFYDQGDTNYYLDPAGVNRLNKLDVGTSGYTMGQTGILQIGNTANNYLFTQGTWSSDIRAGILANCADNWEMAIHDSGQRVVSPFAYFGGSSSNVLHLGRDIGWGVTGIQIPGSLGVGTAPSGTAGEIRATNNITAYYSDDRLKTKLGAIENPIEKVKSLSGFYFEANETAVALGYQKKREVGVSAQEVQAILPEIIAPAPIDDKYMTVRYEKLIPLLIEAIKAQQIQIEELQKLIKEKV